MLIPNDDIHDMRKRFRAMRDELHELELSMGIEADDSDALKLAADFCGLDDDRQAKFVCEVARIFATWEMNGDGQVYAIARHLVACRCSTEAGREWVRSLVAHMERPATESELRHAND